MEFTKQELLDMYGDLIYTRVLGNTFIERIKTGQVPGAVHPSTGEEGINAGLLAGWKKAGVKCYGTPTHRQQRIMAERAGLRNFLAETLGRQTGPNGGPSGEYHLIDIDKGYVPGNGALGGTWGVTAGIGWALKHEKRNETNKEIAFVALGDGAVQVGTTNESMNIAAVYKLPVFFFIENNDVAMGTVGAKEYVGKTLFQRGFAYNMPSWCVNGNDVIELAEATYKASLYALDCIPVLLEATTNRWTGHFIGDDQTAYRDTSFLDHKELIDPVLIHEKKLRTWGWIDDAYVAAEYEKYTKMINDTFDDVLKDPVVTKEQVLDVNRMYANAEGCEM